MNKSISAIWLGAILLAGCQSAQMPTQKGFGNIYGTVTARSHKAIVAKAEAVAAGKVSGQYETLADGRMAYNATMVNYNELDEIYVGVIGATSKRGTIHDLRADDNGFTPRSVALATGDILHITNGTQRPLTFFLAGTTSDTFDELPVLGPGASGNIAVTSSGDFELAADEDERISALILSRPGMAVKRISSGSDDLFENLKPGNYRMVFWFWRLGEKQRQITVIANKSVKLSETLAVDTLVR